MLMMSMMLLANRKTRTRSVDQRSNSRNRSLVELRVDLVVVEMAVAQGGSSSEHSQILFGQREIMQVFDRAPKLVTPNMVAIASKTHGRLKRLLTKRLVARHRVHTVVTVDSWSRRSPVHVERKPGRCTIHALMGRRFRLTEQSGTRCRGRVKQIVEDRCGRARSGLVRFQHAG